MSIVPSQQILFSIRWRNSFEYPFGTEIENGHSFDGYFILKGKYILKHLIPSDKKILIFCILLNFLTTLRLQKNLNLLINKKCLHIQYWCLSLCQLQHNSLCCTEYLHLSQLSQWLAQLGKGSFRNKKRVKFHTGVSQVNFQNCIDFFDWEKNIFFSKWPFPLAIDITTSSLYPLSASSEQNKTSLFNSW